MPSQQDGPVTVVVRHLPKRGREAQFEEWLRGITKRMTQFEGHQGYHIVPPSGPARPEYLVFFRFDTLANLEKWECSAERKEWLDKLEPLSAQAPARERHTGLEVWFSPERGRTQPPRWKMLIVTLLSIYPLISLVQLTIVPFLEHWPVLLRTLVTSTLLVALMTYLVMPTTTRAFSKWLYGSD